MAPRLATLALALGLAANSPARGTPLGGAFLDTGLGARGLGLGGALAAVADGPAAVFYNPAGLAAARGRSLLASYQPMSLDRTQTSLGAALNLRGGLAFGLAWIHAGVDGLRARSGSGEVLEGALDDSQDAVLFAIGTSVTERLQLGAGAKILDHRIDAPQVGTSSASGRAVDLGLRYQLRPNAVLALGLRNLFDKLTWTVVRPSAQTSRSAERLASTAVVGLALRWLEVGLGAVDVELYDLAGRRQVQAHAGTEWRLSQLLTLRAGLHRIGPAGGLGLPTFGITLRPMHRDTLQLHYAYVADEVDAGARTVVALAGRF